jgi:hypothetical protein
MTARTELAEQLIDRECAQAQRQYDAAQKHLDALMAVVTPALHARNAARDRLAKLIAMKQDEKA